MNRIDFVELFGRYNETVEHKDVVYNGNVFPIEISKLIEYKDRSIIYCCVISYGCSSCIDLLPVLKKITEIESLNLILFTDGSVEEDIEITKYFNFPFPVFCTTELIEVIPVPINPYVYAVNEFNIVVSSGMVESYDQFMDFAYSLQLKEV